MKKQVLLAFVLFVSMLSFAKPADFKMVQSVIIPFSPSVFKYDHTPDFGYFLCSTKSDMAMIDGNSGKVLWKINFHKELNDKKFAHQFWNKESNVILVYDEDTRKSIAPKYFIDGKTGSLLWKSDKYVSDFGKYELSEGFRNYYDSKTNGILLPTKENVEFVNVRTGDVIWSKSVDLTGKAKDFNCYIMAYYDLVSINTGKDNSIYLATRTGEEVDNIEEYYDMKKALTSRSRTTVIDIPEKNCYVIMKGKESAFLNILGILGGAGTGFQSWKMKFSAYEMGTNRLLWEREHFIAQACDWITYQPYVRMLYSDGKIFIEHEPNLKTNSGLTVLDVNTGEKAWECYYTTTEMKGVLAVTMTPFPAPDPVVYNGKVYVVDKVKNRVICYGLEHGNKIWESKKFPDAQKIPSLMAVDGKIIMSYGAAAKKIQKTEQHAQSGQVNVCISYNTPRVRVVCSGSTTYTYKYIFNNVDKYGIIAYNAETGNIDWSNETIAKAAKDKFGFIATTQYIDGKLYCATDKNLFVLDGASGKVLGSVPVSKEKLGAIWRMTYFDMQKQFIVDCAKGIVKVDAVNAKVLGSLKTPNVAGTPVQELLDADDDYDDYAIFTSGNIKKMQYKQFASVNLEDMTIRGVHSADVLFYDDPHFSVGGEKFFTANGNKLAIYSVK
ncbi:MAG TPA: PQQ-binding-like beta-propeller repeat protein [Paludibacter sp.]|nr:PQQ-binding-like beta-propeller repeat protein [Paludibacter sp.]